MASTTKHILITPDYIKQATSIDFNVDPALMRDSILWSQLNYIEPIIGTGLYDQVISQHSANTLSVQNAELLNDYIAPALAFYSLYEAADFMAIKFKAIGIGKSKADDFEPLSEKELNSFKNKIKNRAEGWGQRIIAFVNANLEKYPLYSSPGLASDVIYPISNAYTSSIFLPKSRININRNLDNRDDDCEDTNNRITIS